MIRVFSKLKLILLSTIVLITVLFLMFFYRQITVSNEREKEILANHVSSFANSIRYQQQSNRDLANIFYQESLLTNHELLSLIESTNDQSPLQVDQINASIQFELSKTFQLAQNYGFSFFRIRNMHQFILSELHTEDLSKDYHYTYNYSLDRDTKPLGFLQLGVSIRSVITNLSETDSCCTSAIFRKSDRIQNDEAYLRNYTSSPFSADYYIYDQSTLNLSNLLDDRTYEQLLQMIQTHEKDLEESLQQNQSFYITQSIQKNYYTLLFYPIKLNEIETVGYYVRFIKNDELSELHQNTQSMIFILIGLFITLVFIIIFIYYILHYLYHFSYTDHLTKAYNRHKFFEVIPRIIYDFSRYKHPFSVIIIDIDNFKNINDTLGHGVGDEVLIKLVRILETSLRGSDYLFRWGGEEFLALLSNCTAEQGYQVSEKLRKNVELYDFRLKNGSQVTASFGVSTYSHDMSIENLISNADKALYLSKEKGKNRSTLYPGT